MINEKDDMTFRYIVMVNDVPQAGFHAMVDAQAFVRLLVAPEEHLTVPGTVPKIVQVRE